MKQPRAEVIEVIAVQYTRGEGVPGDPVRIVYAYYALTGELLAERDTWAEATPDPDKETA